LIHSGVKRPDSRDLIAGSATDKGFIGAELGGREADVAAEDE
jgi:hypothetical protein